MSGNDCNYYLPSAWWLGASGAHISIHSRSRPTSKLALVPRDKLALVSRDRLALVPRDRLALMPRDRQRCPASKRLLLQDTAAPHPPYNCSLGLAFERGSPTRYCSSTTTEASPLKDTALPIQPPHLRLRLRRRRRLVRRFETRHTGAGPVTGHS